MATKNLRVDTGADKVSIATRTARATLVGTMAPNTPPYANDPSFKTAVDNFVASGVALAAAEKAVTTLEAQLSSARGTRDTCIVATDSCYDVVVPIVQKDCLTPEAMAAAGFDKLDKVNYTLTSPTVEVKFDPIASAIDIHVKRPKGMRSVVTEIGTDPTGVVPFKRLDGDGAKHTVTGYAPGVYWIHAACQRASERSDWSVLVSVTVK